MSQSRVAVVAIHGIGPAQRYALQDEVAENLAARLPGTWEKAAFFPPSSDGIASVRHGSALRLSQKDPTEESDVVFDVYEGYWSPIDKNRTSVPSVLSWMLNAMFAPLNAITPLPATGKKLVFDLGYVFTLIVLVFALPLAALATLLSTYADASADKFAGREVSPGTVYTMVQGNFHILSYGLEAHYLLSLLAGAAGWYIVAHVAASMFFSRRTAGEQGPKGFRWQHTMRLVGVLIGAGLIAFSWSAPLLRHDNFRFHYEPLFLLAVALLIRLSISLAKDFFVNRLGDIQIYTTGDHNSSHYYLRDRILDAVETSLGRVLMVEENGEPYYEAVYVVAHSLGSTIAMDALIHLYQAVEAGDLRRDAWQRIRALITLGTALEKTKFFFASRNPTLTESFQHWRDDVYGRLFTKDPSVLRITPEPHAIFWANYWYFRDIVANKITTYRASTEPNSEAECQDVCYNVRLRDPGRSVFDHPWVHSNYLGDDRFWTGVDHKDRQRIGVEEILTSAHRALFVRKNAA